MRTANLILFLVLISCSTKRTEVPLVRTLFGEIQDGRFSNSYLTLDVPEDWTELDPRDESQFLVITKAKLDFKPSIILFVLDRRLYTNKYGYGTAKEYVRGLTDHYMANKDYELLSQMNSLKIDDRYFYYSEFSMEKDGRKLTQISGVTEMEEYYLAFVATDNLDDLEPEIWTTLKSVRFKEIFDKGIIWPAANTRYMPLAGE